MEDCSQITAKNTRFTPQQPDRLVGFESAKWPARKTESLTSQQRNAVDCVKRLPTNGLLKITALAGAGKTTTLKAIANEFKDERILYLTFSKRLADEARDVFPNNTRVMTTHSMAHSHVVRGSSYAVRPNYRGRELKDLLQNEDYCENELICKLFEAYCNSAASQISPTTLTEIAESNSDLNSYLHLVKNRKDGSDTINFKYLSEKVALLFSKMDNGEIGITHSFYLKKFQLNLEKYLPLIGYDIVLLDEAQDTNDVTLDIITRLSGKKILVGDRHQQIYSFRGSVNAMAKVPSTLECSLSETFRCSPLVASMATSIIQTFKGETDTLVSHSSVMTRPPSAQMTIVAHLTRTNAQLIELIDIYQDSLFTTTKDPDGIFSVACSIATLLECLKTGDKSEFWKVETPFIRLFDSEEALVQHYTDNEDQELKTAHRIAIKYGKRLWALRQIAKRRFGATDSIIVFSTVHTAKGLEWDKVRIEDDFPDIRKLMIDHFPKLTLKEMIELMGAVSAKRNRPLEKIVEEINLVYVAITRAKQHLEIYSPSIANMVGSQEKAVEVQMALLTGYGENDFSATSGGPESIMETTNVFPVETSVVGVTFNNRQEIIAGLRSGEPVNLRRESKNPYDSNAISVDTVAGEQIGYVNRVLAADLAPMLDKITHNVGGKVTAISGGVYTDSALGVSIAFSIPLHS